MLTLRALALAVLAGGCASGGSPEPLAPSSASDYRPSQLRLTAVMVRVLIAANTDIPEAERASLPAAYEGALVEGLNARAVVVRDVGPGTGRQAAAVAAARAREVGADHAIVVDVQIEPDVVRVCEETSPPLQQRATVLKQHASVVRASDGAVRSTLEVKVPALDVDCDAARPTVRSRSLAASTVSAVDRLLGRLLRP